MKMSPPDRLTIKQLQNKLKSYFEPVALISSIITLFLMVCLYVVDYPGVFYKNRFSFISDNLASKPAQGILLLISTTPIWLLLVICIVDQKNMRFIQLNLFACPLSTGIGLVIFDLWYNPAFHYFFTGLFVISIILAHPLVALSSKQKNIPSMHSWYWPITALSLLSGILFGIFATFGQGNVVLESYAVFFEWLTFITIIILNASAGKRAIEHIENKFYTDEM